MLQLEGVYRLVVPTQALLLLSLLLSSFISAECLKAKLNFQIHEKISFSNRELFFGYLTQQSAFVLADVDLSVIV